MKIRLSGKLGANKYAIIDEDDYGLVKDNTWYLHNHGYAYYKINNKKSSTMQSLLMPAIRTSEGRYVVDHINHNRLDNRRINLRYATDSQNAANRPKDKANKSGFKGVSFDERSLKNPWVAYIKQKDVRQNLGGYTTKEEAAMAYDAAAIQLFGEFAYTNILEWNKPI